jgi:hypothetical protein
MHANDAAKLHKVIHLGKNAGFIGVTSAGINGRRNCTAFTNFLKMEQIIEDGHDDAHGNPDCSGLKVLKICALCSGFSFFGTLF